jgi:ABC-type transport system involved in multi-copper enzyme maturation permease subunit
MQKERQQAEEELSSSSSHSAFCIPTSAFRAWLSLVALSLKRQARARQMVWIALGLFAFALFGVLLQTARDRWGMHIWRWPRGQGPRGPYPTFLDWTAGLPELFGALDHSAARHSAYNAFGGAARAILSPDARTVDGKPLACSAFQVFSNSFVFSIFLSFLLPLWSLSFGTEAIGGDRESRSLIWLLSRPLPRPAIYLAKFVALLPWAIGLNVGGFAILCLGAGPPGRLAFELFWPAVLLSTLAFASLFLLLGAAFRRPAILAIVYSFCLEVVLGNMPGYMKRVSVGFYARSMMYERAYEFGVQPDRPGVFLPVEGATAALVLLGATAALVGLGMWVFSRAQYHSEG